MKSDMLRIKTKGVKMKTKMGVVFVALVLVSVIYGVGRGSDRERVYSVEELGQFDGSDPTKPIYIGMDGLVYDVSAGKEYYVTGGPYHDLAGKDSSEELKVAGGEIIRRKYPVVGSLKKSK